MRLTDKVLFSVAGVEGAVDGAHQPGEELAVHALGERVPGEGGALHVHARHDHLVRGRDAPVRQPAGQLRPRHAQQRAHGVQVLVLRLNERTHI